MVGRFTPLILRHKAENLRVLDLTACKITDDVIEGIVMHAPKIQTLILSGCSLLTDRALDSICLLADNLDVLMLAHVANITDRAVVKLVRTCFNLRCVDVAFCRNLTDMSIFELAGLGGLRRLSLFRVHKLTDIAIFALADHAMALERLHLSKLIVTTCYATGIPSSGGKAYTASQSLTSRTLLSHVVLGAFRVFSGENVSRLRKFLDKEDQRRREAELQNIPFAPRSDDRSTSLG
ncbi:hypothetical protein BD779DRAFT_1667626 [Infundibulicybe gibba]|nr:hypothetical protein BD779DRAFT_1667626 [Infundibulicybe gibba]